MTSDISKGLRRLYDTRQNQDQVFQQVNSLHSSLRQQGGSLRPDQCHDALELQKRVYVQSADELKNANNVLDLVKQLVQRRETTGRKRAASAATAGAPVKRYKSGAVKVARPKEAQKSQPPAYTPGKSNIWNHDNIVLQNGTRVAALTDEHSDPPIWILSSVMGFKGGGGRDDRARYSVVDIENSLKVYKLHPNKIIPLPSLELQPLTVRREFKPNSSVLACFPDTTTFYPAKVLSTPSRLNLPEYELAFEDDDEAPSRRIGAHVVAPLPGNYRGSNSPSTGALF